MELGTDFIFRDELFNQKEAGSTVPIELMVDPFAGIVYRYTNVTFKMGEDNIPKMLYDYEIIKTNDLSMMTLRKNQKFNTVLGLILNTLLLDASESEGEIETGKNNTEKSHKERDLHKESSSVS